MANDETEPKSQIIITFTDAHHTNLEVAMAYVDTAQIELAGRFLVRQAETMYAVDRAAQIQRQMQTQPLGRIIPANRMPDA